MLLCSRFVSFASALPSLHVRSSLLDANTVFNEENAESLSSGFRVPSSRLVLCRAIHPHDQPPRKADVKDRRRPDRFLGGKGLPRPRTIQRNIEGGSVGIRLRGARGVTVMVVCKHRSVKSFIQKKCEPVSSDLTHGSLLFRGAFPQGLPAPTAEAAGRPPS